MKVFTAGLCLGLVTIAGPTAAHAADCNSNGVDDDEELLHRRYSLERGRLLASPAWPQEAVALDLDLDGDLDLAVTHGKAAAVAVHRNRGDGFFAPFESFPVGSSMRKQSVRAGDLDADGRLDLVVTNGERASVSLLRGRPGGTVEPWMAIATGALVPLACELIDVDHDQDFDVVVLGELESGAQLRIYTNAGSERLEPAATSELPGMRAVSLHRGHWDADGAMDALALAFNADLENLREEIVPFLSSVAGGDGLLPANATSIAGIPHAAAVADLDGDGRTDLALGHTPEYPQFDLSVLMSTGDGRFHATQSFRQDLPVAAVAPGDIDGIPGDDLLVARGDHDRGAFHAFVNRGDGYLAVQSQGELSAVFAAAADWTGDGLPDAIVVTDEFPREPDGGTRLRLLEGEWRTLAEDANHNGILDGCERGAEDCNQNGLADIVETDSPPVTFSVRQELGEHVAIAAMAAMDLDLDQVAELAAAARWIDKAGEPQHALFLYSSNPAGALVETKRIALESALRLSLLVPGDFDGDGWPDLTAFESPYQAGSRAVFFGSSSGELLPPVPIPIPGEGQPSAVLAGDLDSDGAADLLLTTVASPTMHSKLRVLHGGAGGWNLAAQFSLLEASPRLLSDLNLDGLLDLALTDVDLLFWAGQADGGFKDAGGSVVVAASANSLSASDFDGDGDYDLSASSSNRITTLENLGAWRFEHGPSIAIDHSALTELTDDFDGDGREELVVLGARRQCHYGARTSVHLLLTRGRMDALTLATGIDLDENLNAGQVVLGDWNRDGRKDLAALPAAQGTESPGIRVLLQDSTPGGIDCNSNRIPDSCELDCDGNSIPDECDLRSGARDCDHNGIPDVCQGDLNQDGVTAACDFEANAHAAGNAVLGGSFSPVPDCNGNGVADAVDIASRVSFRARELFQIDGTPFVSGDLDGDGVSEIAVASGNSLALTSPGRVRFAPWPALGVSALPKTVTPADLDHDGRQDLIVLARQGACEDVSQLTVWRQTAHHQFAEVDKHVVRREAQCGRSVRLEQRRGDGPGRGTGARPLEAARWARALPAR